MADRSGGRCEGHDGRDVGGPGQLDPEVVDLARRRREVDDRIGMLAAQVHALGAELVAALAEFDELGGWQGGGFRSYAQWLSIRAKFTPADARRLCEVASRLDRVPRLLAGGREGRVSVGMLGVAARVSNPDNEAKVAQIVEACTPAQAQRVLGKYRQLAPRPRPRAPRRSRSRRSGGGSGSTPAEGGSTRRSTR